MDKVEDSTPISPSQASNPPLQLMLFVNRRAKADRQVKAIRQAISELGDPDRFELKVVEISARPSLVEHFKLVAVPALVKTHPLPEQVFAGSDLIYQLQYWWPRWQLAMQESTLSATPGEGLMESDVVMPPTEVSEKVLQLADEIFELKQENIALEEQLKFRDRVMAILAHDLRSPLSTASLALETLELGLQEPRPPSLQSDTQSFPSSPAEPRKSIEHDPGNSAKQIAKTAEPSVSSASTNVRSSGPPPQLSAEMMRRLARQARRQLHQLDEMMQDILQAACGETDELRIYPAKLDLKALCREVIAQQRDRIVGKHQHLEVDIPSDLPDVCADPERIRQVLLNLFDNAIKYTPEGGELLFSCLHRTSQTVQVSLSDTGPGIPEGLERTIFNDSFRLPRDEEMSGYGIGLSVCRQVILAHYGRIWVSSNFPQGSSFHFTLPVYT